MKRVLFYYDNFCSDASKGGTEVATYRIAKALKDTGRVEVFHAFRSKSDGKDKSIYQDVIKLDKSELAFERYLKEFIIANKIDVIINMGRFFRHKVIYNAARFSERDVKLIFMHHFAPGSEMKKGTFESGRHLFRLNPKNPIYWLRATIYPLIKLSRNLAYPKKYKEVYKKSGKVVLLSEGYKKKYQEIGEFSDEEKFAVIPNIYEGSALEQKNQGELKNKSSKRVLFLSRLDEIQKRVSTALKIWGEIEKDASLDEWHLDIVGSGHNADIAYKVAKELGLKRVTFHGWQKSEPFLQDSEILMSTSDYEGLPLSMIEAQSFGCVPIAFNTYASLSDFIDNGENGIIVEADEGIKGYAEKLSALMKDEELRRSLKEKSKNNAERFTSKIISQEWLKILT